MIIPTTEPFLFKGNRVGCLLIHGFTGTPKEMRRLGEFLATQGFSVLGIRLTGHATQIEDMQRAHWRDWYASVEDGYHYLSGITDQIFLIGLSLGGILSLTFASQKLSTNCPVSGVVAMSTPHHLPANPLLLSTIKLLSLALPLRPKSKSDWQDHAAEMENISYEKEPTRQLAELRDLLVIMRAGLPNVKIPVLLIYSRDDQVFTPEEKHAYLIHEALGSPKKQTIWIEQSGHNITSDSKSQEVFRHIAQFIIQETTQSK